MTAVSIITPAYKAEPFIARAVRSVLAQTHGDWEMIVVADDGLDYEAFLKAQGISDARLRFATTGRIAAGPAVARNVGLDAAKFDMVANLDADDAYAPDFMRHIIPAAETHGAATGRMDFIDEDSGEKNANVIYPGADGPLTLRQILRHSFSYQDIVFDRRRSRARWPEALRYGEDIVFWTMLLDDLPGIYYASAAYYHYYIRQGSLSRFHPPEDTMALCRRLKAVARYLETHPALIRKADNREFLMRWFSVRHDIEEFFDYKIVAPEVYIAELNRRYDRLFGAP